MKKKNNKNLSPDSSSFDPELMRLYMMGATNPGFSNKIDNALDEIDLHLEQTELIIGKIPSQDALFHQLDEFEKALDKAIAAGKFEFRVVHGLGKGKLKEEIFKLLEKHPYVKRYSNEFHSRYGYGSTIIYFF